MSAQRSSILRIVALAAAGSFGLAGCAQNEAATKAAQATLKSPSPPATRPPVAAGAPANAAPKVATAGFDRRTVVVEENVTEHVFHKPVHVDEATYVRRKGAEKRAE